MVDTLFDLPTSPEEFGVALPSPDLRKIDYSALEFDTLRRAAIEYIKTYYPNEFNDFVSNNGIIMLVELISYIGSVMSLRSDILANEAFLPTARTEDAVASHLALIGQKFKRQTPAQADVECNLDIPVTADIHIPAGTQFTIRGSDGDNIVYEIYRSPGDFITSIVIPAEKRGIIAYGIEGESSQVTVVSDGTASQEFFINDANILGEPVSITTRIGQMANEWTRIDFLEMAGPIDEVYEVQFFESRAKIIFGDGEAGQIPPPGSNIEINYRIGGGVRGRIGVGQIDTSLPITPELPLKSPVPVNFRNLSPSVGGTDKETLEAAKRRAPRDFATHAAAVTSSDYAQLASSFSHPVFGTVVKGVASITTSLNTNLVELYVLAEESDGVPTIPNAGLRLALSNYIDEINVLTDKVEVLDGVIKPVDIDMTVTMSRNADASIIKGRVESELLDFFHLRNWDLGEPLYISRIYQTIMAIDGITNVDIFSPVDNILPSGELAGETGGTNFIGINELISLGSTEIKYYYARLNG